MYKSKQTLLITGASSGIGEALALHYAIENYHLILIGRNNDRLKNVAERCETKGATCEFKVIDVCDREGLRFWLEEMIQKTPIDLLIANAGISGGTAGLTDSELIAQTRQIYDVNIGGVLNTLEPVLKGMMGRRSGQIALMSSMASYAPWPGAPAYSSSKAAIRFLGHSLRGTLRPYGIKVSVICPGFIESRITAQNTFPMPFFRKAPYAAQKIAKGLEKNKMTIAFPMPLFMVSVFMSLLPSRILLYINSKMPKKTSL